MKKITLLIAFIVLFPIICNIAYADRQLSRAEVLQIFQTLTSQPINAWVPSGVIKASHLEYNTSIGYIISETYISRYDGNRFYVEINMDSSDKIESATDVKSHNFIPSKNIKKIFVWDGQKYTMYFIPTNHAIVNEGQGDVPMTVNSPLNAGIPPWGRGFYTYESLSSVESSITETEVDGQNLLHLTIVKTDFPEITFELDSSKNYAVLSWKTHSPGQSTIEQTYGNYQLHSGKWIPTYILIDRFDESKQPRELLSHDEWTLNYVNICSPNPESFKVPYETDALVEYYSTVDTKPFWYRHYDDINTDLLLQEKISLKSAQDTTSKNCATAAVKYVLRQLGRDINDQQLSQLVSDPNKGTDLYTMKQFVEGLNLNCCAVKTNIQILKSLQNCQTILHLPNKNHYVVCEYIDGGYVWIIDFYNNNFYYRVTLDAFAADWTEGTALVISNNTLDSQSIGNILSDDELQQIVGSAGTVYTNFSCTELIQQYKVIHCPKALGGLCGGAYRVFFNRYGCVPNPNGGTCSGSNVIGNMESPCIVSIEFPGECDVTGTWYPQDIHACQ